MKAPDHRAPALGTIVFSHANSFPAGTYRLLFDVWGAAGWNVIALPRIGHNAAFPVTRNWPHLLAELAQFVDQHAAGQPLHLVGHSLGGFLSLMLACQRPQQVATVVMLDSPVVAGWRASAARAARALGVFERVSPARVARGRRQHWPSTSAALAHYAAKPAFARWDARMLQGYIESGIEADPQPEAPQAVRLAFSRDVEAQIYATLPLRLPALLRRQPPSATLHFVAGTRSAELRQAGMAATRTLVGQRLQWIEGTHLFPMERPEETAAAVLGCLGARSTA